MYSLLLITSLLGAPDAVASASHAALTLQDDDRRAEFDEKRAAAKGDKEALWEVHNWCSAFGMEREGNSILKEILRLDDEDARAHELLGHVKYDGQWFTTEKKLEAYKKKRAAAVERREREEAEAKGWVKYKGGYIDPADIPFLEKGWSKNAAGEWVDPAVQQRLDEGWKRQDMTWISPAEFPELESGKWKVGDTWMSIEAADIAHSVPDSAWMIPIDSMVVHSTLPRALTLDAGDHMRRSLQEVRRFFGADPAGKFQVVLSRSIDQFSEIATDNDLLGMSSVTWAYLGTGTRNEAGAVVPMGGGYWDVEGENGAALGNHSVRLAASFSFIDAIDPSPQAIAPPKRKSKRGEPVSMQDFLGEKRLPLVLSQGLAVYGARYFIDRAAAAGGDPFWARKWSLQNLQNQGGLRAPALVLSFPFWSGGEISPDAGQTLLEAGALVAFILDGENEAVTTAHRAWKEVWNSGNDLEAATQALFEAVAANWEAFQAFVQV